uniref:Reverse transcriptase/retrotransposon-derived protein RNase H-like domain-containing protein n=1 Tax=Sinocyclocheilus grahami TaxID=75366 RepID=A0A672LFS7_SINGR
SSAHYAFPLQSLNWTEVAELPFTALKQAITTAPAFGLRNYSKNFHLHSREVEGVVIGILLQLHGSTYKPLAYPSKKLDNIASGMPACLCAVAATVLAKLELPHWTHFILSGFNFVLTFKLIIWYNALIVYMFLHCTYILKIPACNYICNSFL